MTATDKQKQKRRWQAGKVADNETQRAYRKKQRQIVDRQTGTEANRDKGETETETDRREEKQTGTAANRQRAGPEQRQTGEFDIRRQQQTETLRQRQTGTAANKRNVRQRQTGKSIENSDRQGPRQTAPLTDRGNHRHFRRQTKPHTDRDKHQTERTTNRHEPAQKKTTIPDDQRQRTPKARSLSVKSRQQRPRRPSRTHM